MSTGKRGNGEGSLYQRKSDGRWLAVYVAPDGKRRTMVAATRQEASKRLTEALKAREDGTLITAKKQTVEQYLAGWLRDSVKPRVRPWTYTGYEVLVRVHIVPVIGKVALDKLTPAMVQELMNKRTAAGLSPKTVRYMRSVLRTALGQALRWGLVSRNVAALVDGPKVERHEIKPLDREDAHKFLAVIRGDRLEALYSVALSMGLRQAEALGLRWQDVDLEAGILNVRHQLQRLDGVLQVVPLKTGSSRRTLALPDSIRAGLREHRLRALEERLRAGELWTGPEPNETNAFVFTSPLGVPIDGRTLLRWFKALLAKAGLEDRRFHDLRHSCATLLLVQGVSPRVVMEILGHSEIALTMNVYSHVVPELGREAARRMDAVLGL